MRSSGEEEVEQEQHQEMLKEEAKENNLSFDRLCNVADSTLKTSSEEQPTEEQQTCSATVDDNIEKDVLSKDLNVDVNDRPVTEAKDIIICSPEHEEIVSAEENKTPEGQYLEALSKPDLLQTETKNNNVDTQSCDNTETCNKFFEKQESTQEAVEESNLNNTELCHQQNIIENAVKESLPDESTPAASNTECCQELENAEEENNVTEELSSKSQPQGATASGKKKKRKRRTKKKGGINEDKNQQKDGKKESSKTGKDLESAKGDNGSTTECNIDIPTSEALKELKMDQVNEQDSQETEGIGAAETVEPTESSSLKEELNDPRVDHITNEHTRQSLEAETIEEVVVAPAKSLADIETPQETKTCPTKDRQDKEESLETDKAEKVDSITSPTEASLSSSDFIDTTNSTEGTDDLDKRCTSSLDNSKSGGQSNNHEVVHSESEIVHQVGDGVGSVDEIKSAYTTNNSESSPETNGRKNTEGESHVQSNCDIAAEELKSTDNSQMLNLKDSPDSEPPSEAIKVFAREPEELAEIVKDPGIDTEQDSYPPSDNDDNSELKQDTTEMEMLTGNLRDPEDLIDIYSSSHDEKGDSCDIAALEKNTELDSEESLLETVAQAEQINEFASQRLEFVDQTDESNLVVSSETEEINTTTTSNTTHSPKEATEIDTPIEQESTVAEDLQHENCKNDKENETRLRALDEQLHETSKDKPESDESSQPTEHDCNEDDCEDEEGQSFDFDDMDMEVAIATNPEEERAEDAVEVTLDEIKNISSVQCQSNSEPDEKTQENPAQSNDEKTNQVDTLEKEPDNLPQDDRNSLAHEATPEKEENVCEVNTQVDQTSVADEGMHITEEGKVIAVGELGVVAETIKQATSVPVEEGLDAIKLEVQDEGLVLPKSEDQLASSKELPQSGKDGKKNSKKGKAKSKEECKMS